MTRTGMATFVRNVDGWLGDARPYRVDPGVDFTEYDPELGVGTKKSKRYVVVSGIEGRAVRAPKGR
jgi:hypothetical protein